MIYIGVKLFMNEEANKMEKKEGENARILLKEVARKVDILAFGAHPDDVEIGMAGSIKKWTNAGYKVAICDLTYADLSSNGTVALRMKEAEEAANRLNVQTRLILGLKDRGLFMTEEAIQLVVQTIRQYQPMYIFMPYEVDRHPDHGNCSRIVKEAIFSAKIKNFEPSLGEKWAIQESFYYMINGFHRPHFVMDVTETMDAKIEALQAYESQFSKKPGTVDTPLTNGYIETVRARESLFGKEVGVSYAEGFMCDRPLLFNPLGGF